MIFKTLAAGAAMTLLASPAFADCAQEVRMLDEAIVANETGAATGDSAMPASPHQEQVLSDDDQAAEESGMPATKHQEEVLSGEQERTGQKAEVGTGDVSPTTPHQRQVVRGLDEDTRSQASDLVSEASEMAQAGDEQGCMAKLSEAKALLGTK